MIKIQKKKLRNCAIVGIIILIAVLAVLAYVIYYKSTDTVLPHYYVPEINLEVYDRDNSSNKIVWVVKNVSDNDVLWEDIEGFLGYKNNTKVRNCTKLPQKKYVRSGDLITVIAP